MDLAVLPDHQVVVDSLVELPADHPAGSPGHLPGPVEVQVVVH